MCHIPDSQLRVSSDRGTPLICDNKLAGILSIIIAVNKGQFNIDSCTKSLHTYAYYTGMHLYENWIHSVIGVNAPSHTPEGHPIPLIPDTLPYQSMNSVWRYFIYSEE